EAARTAGFANLKTIIYGGAPMYVADLKRALALFGPRLYQLFGQGESPMTITGLSKQLHAAADHPRYETLLASCGYARTGEEVIAFVVARPGASVSQAALDAICLDNIARYKRPREYRFVDALPKSNYGKVLKTELRHKLGENGKP